MTLKQLIDKCHHVSACGAAVVWLQSLDSNMEMEEVLNKCPRGEWLLWALEYVFFAETARLRECAFECFMMRANAFEWLSRDEPYYPDLSHVETDWWSYAEVWIVGQDGYNELHIALADIVREWFDVRDIK